MNLYPATGGCLVALALLARWGWGYLKRLEQDSRSKAFEGLLEPPDKVVEIAPPSLFDDATKSLSLVIPAYNEEDRLPPTLEEALLYLRQRRDKQGPLFTYEVIVVDDGSTDRTAQAAGQFTKRYGLDAVRVLRMQQNRGKGYAVRSGMLTARGQNILFMDADGATKVSDVEKLEAELQRMTSGSKAEALGMVVGSRAHLESEAIAKRHWYRNLLMHGFHLLVLCVAGGAVRDTQCGFKLFSRRAARLLYSNLRLQRWCFDVELLFLAQRLTIPVKEVAVAWTEIAGSKIKFTSVLHMSWELVSVLLGYVLTKGYENFLQDVLKRTAPGSEQMAGLLQTNALQPGLGSVTDSSARTLWIGDLAYYVDEAFLSNVFASTGALTSVKVIRNRTTQVSEGYGFLEFSTQEAAQQVLNTLNGKLIPNTDQTFRLNWAGQGFGKMLEGDSPDHSVFVGDLAVDVTDYVLQEHFRRYFASVRSPKVITDSLTGRSKGYGFVRFGSEQERDRALGEMMGHFISNRPIRVSIATAKKNTPGYTSQGLAQGIPHPSDFDPTNTTLFIGGLSGGVSEEDLRLIFGQFGDIVYTKIPPGKGCGFVQFVQRPAAESALTQLQGQVIGSSPIRLSWGRSSATSRSSLTTSAAPYSYPAAYGSSAFPGYAAGYGTALTGQASNPSLDPYAAYAYAMSHQQSADPNLYQAYQQQVALAAGGTVAGGASGASALHNLLALQRAKPEQVDPLAGVDVDKLNAAYLQRHQSSLLGALASMPAIRTQAS